MILDSGESIGKLEEPHIHTNVLLAHGSGDMITSFDASKQFFEKLSVPENSVKESLFIDGAYHERTRTYMSPQIIFLSLVHNDLCSDEVITKYISWILKLTCKEN